MSSRRGDVAALTRALVGLDRLAVEAGELADVAARLPHSGPVLGGDVSELPRRVQRAGEELRGLDVRELRLRALAGGDRGPPRVGPALAVEVVERHDLELLAALALELDGRARVERGPAAEREPRVRRVADERVPEAEASRDVRIAFDELGEPGPSGGVARPSRLVDEGGDELAGKRLAQDRSPAEEGTVGAVQPVDATRQHRLDRLRELVIRPGTRGTRGDELLEEQRVAAGTGGDRIGFHLGDVRAGRTDERLGVVGSEGLEPHGQRRHGRRPVGGGEPSCDGPSRCADEPGVSRQVPAEVAEELG